MADANQLKIEARRKEASGDYAAASELYQRALAAMDAGNSLPDPSLLVRVADLEYRQDDADSALGYYHRAVEDYAEQGLITNAIAVCNKILRVFPDEIGCYRRLADLHMDVGLVAEARQNMLRYVDQAWEEDDTDPALEAMEELLARSPDQEIALKMATCLARLDREKDALEVLARVWRERTKADADVEALERKARDLDPDVDLDDWLPDGAEEVDEPGLAGADSFVSDDGADPADAPDDATVSDDATDADDTPAHSPLDELAEAARDMKDEEPAETAAAWDEGADDAPEDEHASTAETAAAAPDVEENVEENVEELAGFPDLQVDDEEAEELAASAADDDGRLGDPFGDRSDETAGTWDESPQEDGIPERDPAEPWSAERPELEAEESEESEESEGSGEPIEDDLAPEPATITNRLEAVEEDARELELVASFPDWFTEMAMTRPSNGSPPGPAASRADSWEERTMDELDELEARAEADLATGEQEHGPGALQGSLDDEPGGGGMGRERPEDFAAGREVPVDGPSEGDLGEEEELRRGLELLDELLEVDPDNTELKERKVRYARRLGDGEELVEAYLDLADAMADRGSRRGARLLYEKVLELDEGNAEADAGLGRLDRGELEQKRSSGRGGDAKPPAREASPEQKEARRHLGMRLWTEFEKAVQEMPWLHAATQTYQSTSPEAAPPVEAFEMLAHYLISRDRCREAADILEQAVRMADRSDEEIADALYYLGLAHDRLGESEKAAEYYRRLDAVDPEFASVREWLPADEQAGA